MCTCACVYLCLYVCICMHEHIHACFIQELRSAICVLQAMYKGEAYISTYILLPHFSHSICNIKNCDALRCKNCQIYCYAYNFPVFVFHMITYFT